jgi:hypothetical protein
MIGMAPVGFDGVSNDGSMPPHQPL